MVPRRRRPATTTNSLAATIPETVFITFQMTFAIITPALIAGAFAERMKFSAMMWFIGAVAASSSTARSRTGSGAAASSARPACSTSPAAPSCTSTPASPAWSARIVLGKRKGYGTVAMAPHNLTWSFIGASLLWVGWFGFNAGSAVGANALAGAAMINTQVAAAGAALAWMFAEWIIAKKPSVLGIISGAVAGLVAITPAAGFVNPTGALIIGLVAGVVCYVAAVHLKKAFGYDDSLDAFGVHGVGGIIGALLTGVFADAAINELGKDAQHRDPGLRRHRHGRLHGDRHRHHPLRHQGDHRPAAVGSRRKRKVSTSRCTAKPFSKSRYRAWPFGPCASELAVGMETRHCPFR